MAFGFILVRDAESDDGDLYPTVATDGAKIRISDDDGDVQPMGQIVKIIGLFRGDQRKRAGSFDTAKSNLAVTDSRVVVWCKKFDKGGGFVGFSVTGWAVAGVANAVSKGRAAGRRRGSCLVGHVRYPWLISVDYLSKQGALFRTEEIRLFVQDRTDGPPTTARIDLTLNSSTSARSLANEIVKRAAVHRLKHKQGLDAEQVASLSKLARDGANVGDPGSYVRTSLPGAVVVDIGTAISDPSVVSNGETHGTPEPQNRSGRGSAPTDRQPSDAEVGHDEEKSDEWADFVDVLSDQAISVGRFLTLSGGASLQEISETCELTRPNTADALNEIGGVRTLVRPSELGGAYRLKGEPGAQS